MKTYFQPLLIPIFIFGLILTAIGCDSTPADSGALDSEQMGRLRLLLTDAPFPFELVDSTNVTITRIEMVPATDSLKRFVVSTDTVMFNLLDLQNGVTAVLADTTIPAGSYSQMRLLIQNARIVLIDSSEFDLKIPSGSTSGLKILLRGFEIGVDSLTEMTLDFDLEKSFVVQGNPSTPAGIKGFHFKPVIKPIGYAPADATGG